MSVNAFLSLSKKKSAPTLRSAIAALAENRSRHRPFRLLRTRCLNKIRLLVARANASNRVDLATIMLAGQILDSSAGAWGFRFFRQLEVGTPLVTQL
jgi:hypothetical protein